MTFEEMWSKQPPLECKDDLLKDNIHLLKWCYEKGQQDKMDQQCEIDYLMESKIELEKTFEKLLHELRDRNIVNWWLNGEGYHWEFNEDVRRKYEGL